MLDAFANGITLEAVLEVLKRRLWLVVTLGSLVMAVVLSLAAALPKLYSASATILVEGQQIPEDYVRSTVILGLQRRLQLISQEILSRPILERLVMQFGLYKDLVNQSASNGAIAAAMRRDVGLQIQGRSGGASDETVAFAVSYTNADPRIAMEVANALASYYVEANLKVREQQALGTSSFLQNEIEQVKKKLEDQERRVAQYKQQYMGELPEQLTANLSTLDLLQKQLQIIAGNLASAQEHRNILLRQMAEQSAVVIPGTTETSKTMTPAERFEALQQSLAEMKTRLSDKHPDVIRTKQAIAVIETQLQNRPGLSQPSDDTALGSVTRMLSPAQRELAETEAEIRGLQGNLQKVQRDIAVYQQRVEITPKREQEFTTISRDYESTKEHYLSLLKRLDEAKLADRLEQGQKAERFRILEPAVLPEKPVAPQFVRLLLFGLAMSLGIAAVGAVLGEIIDPTLHRIEDLQSTQSVEVLTFIPRIVTPVDRVWQRRRFLIGGSALAFSLLVVATVSCRLAAGNEQLTRLLARPAGGLQIQ